MIEFKCDKMQHLLTHLLFSMKRFIIQTTIKLIPIIIDSFIMNTRQYLKKEPNKSDFGNYPHDHNQ